jgi:hypothetical protein
MFLHDISLALIYSDIKEIHITELAFLVHSMRRKPMTYLSNSLVRRTQGLETPKTG